MCKPWRGCSICCCWAVYTWRIYGCPKGVEISSRWFCNKICSGDDISCRCCGTHCDRNRQRDPRNTVEPSCAVIRHRLYLRGELTMSTIDWVALGIVFVGCVLSNYAWISCRTNKTYLALPLCYALGLILVNAYSKGKPIDWIAFIVLTFFLYLMGWICSLIWLRQK